jgi:hypothetical protein
LQTLVWSPKAIGSLFDFKWEDTQLHAVIKDLDIPSACSVSGGAVVRTLMKQDIFKGDIDIFAHTPDGLTRAIEKYSKVATWQTGKHAFNFVYKMGVRETKVQIITIDKPQVVKNTFSTFDFEHCKMGILIGKNHLSGTSFSGKPKEEDAFVSTLSSPIVLAQRKLRLGMVRDPAYSLGRAIKYKRLGFDADEAIEQLAAMAIKGMSNVQCCAKDDWSSPHPASAIDEIVKSCSS